MTDALRVLVPVDGSPESESILPALLPLLRSRASEVTLLSVAETPEEADPARAALRRLAKALLLDGVRAMSRLEWGHPADEIDYLARPARHDLVAMSTHGRSGLRRVLLGSTAETVLRRARIPLILTRPGARVGDWNRIVLAVDGVTPPDPTLKDLEPLALALNSVVHVVHVAGPLDAEPNAVVEGVCDALAGRGLLAVAAPLQGDPAVAISAYLEKIGAGLLAMTTHGRAGLGRALSGSLTEDVVRHCSVPVFIRRAEPSPIAAIA
jgi:nucleotide-binding universal stress UspA family protein